MSSSWLSFEFLGTRALWCAGLAAVAVVGAMQAPQALAQESETEVFAIARGGLFYDSWYEALEMIEPKQTHPAYPAAGKQSGAATWRCKECHGWDYRGVDGAYGQGSHFTGIKGIRETVGVDPAVIAAVIRDDVHAYSQELLSDSAVEKLALFVSRGQLDMAQYIDSDSKQAHGEAARGARFFQTICAVCHGFDGKTLNFGDEAEPEYVGTVASDNPWEALHKIRNGQPGVQMIALAVLSVQDQVDILAYAQTLPAE